MQRHHFAGPQYQAPALRSISFSAMDSSAAADVAPTAQVGVSSSHPASGYGRVDAKAEASDDFTPAKVQRTDAELKLEAAEHAVTTLRESLGAKEAQLRGAHEQNVAGHATTVEQADRIAKLQNEVNVLRLNMEVQNMELLRQGSGSSPEGAPRGPTRTTTRRRTAFVGLISKSSHLTSCRHVTWSGCSSGSAKRSRGTRSTASSRSCGS